MVDAGNSGEYVLVYITNNIEIFPPAFMPRVS